MIPLRRCSKCKEEHPISFFNKDKTKKDGLYPQCKNCSRRACRDVYRKYEDQHKAQKQRWKKENSARHREINRAYREANPERVRETIYRWRKANPEKARKWQKENPARVLEIYKRWKDANPERVREIGQKYAAANPHKIRAKCARRRAGLARATPAWVDHELLEFLYSECPPGWHVDHIYPLKGKNSCGLHVPWNLQYLSASENCKKSNKPPVVQEAWYNL